MRSRLNTFVHTHRVLLGLFFIILNTLAYLLLFSNLSAREYRSEAAHLVGRFIPLPALDRKEYDARLYALAHRDPLATTTATSTRGWPVLGAYPKEGAILPFRRVIAYYGNFYSIKMGVLGEYPAETLIPKLKSELKKWQEADPKTPTLPAIQYIATVAQGSAGKEGKYILRMPDTEIDKALALAHEVNGIVILDVQVAKSTLEYELPLLKHYLVMPQVHLAIDPEFSMKSGDAPGHVIGTMDASDINYAADFLATLVRENNLPPKLLVVHRFTQNMVTNYKNIRLRPEVQIVIDMDGWGSAAKKKGTYRQVITPEPVQFTGIKLFYKNDLKPPSTGLLTTEEVLGLMPAPIYIQYQ